MYCSNCGAKLPDKKTKYCPACGSPIINQKKNSPIIDAIILGSILILFIFAVIKISKILTDYKLGKLKSTTTKVKTEQQKNTTHKQMPEVRAPIAPGTATFSSIKEPKMVLLEKIKNVLKGVNNEVSINYNRILNGYEVDVTIYKNEALTLNEYLNLFANIFATAYSDSRNNVKFVICKVVDSDKTRLSMAIGAEAASKIPFYTWDMFSRNGLLLIRWVEKHQTPPSVGKILMCRFQNNF